MRYSISDYSARLTGRAIHGFIQFFLSLAVLQTSYGIPACQSQEMRASSKVTSAEHATEWMAGRQRAAETWTLAGLQAAQWRKQ